MSDEGLQPYDLDSRLDYGKKLLCPVCGSKVEFCGFLRKYFDYLPLERRPIVYNLYCKRCNANIEFEKCLDE